MGDGPNGILHRRARRLTTLAVLAMTLGAIAPARADPTTLSWSFDDATTSQPPTYVTQFPQPDFVPGITGKAWRSDGFSSWVSAPLTLNPDKGFTVSGWVALESYPSDLERPVEDMKPASLFQQANATSGFDLHIDAFGRWGFRVSTDHGDRVVVAHNPFPLSKWAFVAATYDPATGTTQLYLDGQPVGTHQGAPAQFKPATTPFAIAHGWQAQTMGIFTINGVNAAFDDVQVTDHADAAPTIAQAFQRVTVPEAAAALAVPRSRFAADFERPRLHAMPTANWTNEPHGLIRRDDVWHMFFQRTPNGPYKTLMHWGHMASTDLVHWAQLPDALWPTLQTPNFGFDMKGIWSGDVVSGPHGAAYAFYTSVNHSPNVFNPGISVAVSADPALVTWVKRGPVINTEGVRDFRDPYVWNENGVWKMIVGAAIEPKGGGLAFYQCSDIDNIHCWKKQARMAPFADMDIGSDIWEMPVFLSLGGGKFILEANPIGGAISKYGDPSTRAVYWIGHWDGSHFQPDFLHPKMLDLVPGHLSPTVDRDANGVINAIGIVDERRTTEAQRKAGWAHTFSFPRQWRLMPDGETLGQSPLPALQQLRSKTRTITQPALAWTGVQTLGALGPTLELSADFGAAPPTGAYGVSFATSPDGAETTRVLYNPVTHDITVDKRKSSLGTDNEGPQVLTGHYDAAAFGPPRSFHVYVDHSVVDVFINDAAAFSFRIYPTRTDSTGFGVISDTPATARIEAWALGVR